MRKFWIILLIIITIISCKAEEEKMSKTKLTPEEEYVIKNKGTERPFTGKYYDFYEEGTYLCKQCGAELYNSTSKFNSNCGWPSFDDEIEGAVKRVSDKDGMRTEIICNQCGGHLGHVFEGEGFTSKNTRHCVNSISLNFIPKKSNQTLDTAIFAGGCFWGMEYYFKNTEGVVDTKVGYIGGTTENPTYKEVCYENTGHAEAILVVFDNKKTTFENLCKLFFEIHDPEQYNRQGPDIGDQYRSEIFYLDENQKEIAKQLITQLIQNGYDVVTRVTKATEFYPAEDYHQEYYGKNGKKPYCHFYQKRF